MAHFLRKEKMPCLFQANSPRWNHSLGGIIVDPNKRRKLALTRRRRARVRNLEVSLCALVTSIRATSSPIYRKVNPVCATCFSFKQTSIAACFLLKNMFVHFDKNMFLITKHEAIDCF